MEREDTGSGPVRRPPDDAELAARLGDLLRHRDPAGAAAIELAKLSFGWRGVDAELAALVADSDTGPAAMALAVRDQGASRGPRLLTFEVSAGAAAGEPAALEMEVGGGGRYRRLLGQLHPPGPARIELRQPAGAPGRWAEADDRGRFVIEEIDPGPMSLTWHRPGHRPVTTAWTIVD